jgi:hypothetical protein
MDKTLFIIFLLCLLCLFKYLFYNQVCYVETFDSQVYLVRNVDDKRVAAEMLFNIRKRLILLVDTIILDMENDTKHKYADKYYGCVKTIQKKLPHSIIKESSATSQYTSYTTNKGEEIVFCLRSKKHNKLHKINDIMYVAIHEIAHIGCPEIGHTKLFNKINKFLLTSAIDQGIYDYRDYKHKHKEYCGIKLTNTILDSKLKF